MAWYDYTQKTIQEVYIYTGYDDGLDYLDILIHYRISKEKEYRYENGYNHYTKERCYSH